MPLTDRAPWGSGHGGRAPQRARLAALRKGALPLLPRVSNAVQIPSEARAPAQNGHIKFLKKDAVVLPSGLALGVFTPLFVWALLH
jgi:hypothetical protein